MSELKRKSGEAVKAIGEQAATKAGDNGNDTQSQHPVVKISVTYDELDFRLMATFPASDAVAQY